MPGGPPDQLEPTKPPRMLWVWWSLLPLGLGSWAPLVPGRRERSWTWSGLGLFWVGFTILAFILGGSAADAMLWFAWIGSIVTSFMIRGQIRERWRRASLAAAETGGVGQQGAAASAGPPALAMSDAGSSPAASVPGPPQPPTRHGRARWPWLSLLPLGLGSWAPMIAAARCRVWWWWLIGCAGVAATFAGFVIAGSGGSDPHKDTAQAAIGSILMFTAWLGGAFASFAIRPAYEARTGYSPSPKPLWPQPTSASLNWTVRYALAAYVLSFVAALALGFVLIDVLGLSLSVGVAVLLTDLTLLAGLLPLARRRGLVAADIGIRPTLALRSLGLVCLALVSYVILGALWAAAFIGRTPEHAAVDLSQVRHLGTAGIVVAVIAIAFSAPIVEEVFFRGLVYRSLRNRLPVAAAALIAGCMFGLVHIFGYPLITLPIKAIFGVIACLLYERTGSLLPGIALHSFVDASAIEIALTGNNFIVLGIAGVLVFVILVRVAVQRLRRPEGAVLGLERP